MKLIPSEKNIKSLKDDYEHMKNMIYGEKPNFDDILKTVKLIEDEINALFKPFLRQKKRSSI